MCLKTFRNRVRNRTSCRSVSVWKGRSCAVRRTSGSTFSSRETRIWSSWRSDRPLPGFCWTLIHDLRTPSKVNLHKHFNRSWWWSDAPKFWLWLRQFDFIFRPHHINLKRNLKNTKWRECNKNLNLRGSCLFWKHYLFSYQCTWQFSFSWWLKWCF